MKEEGFILCSGAGEPEGPDVVGEQGEVGGRTGVRHGGRGSVGEWRAEERDLLTVDARCRGRTRCAGGC